MNSYGRNRLDRLEDKVRSLADDRALSLVRQLKSMSERGSLTDQDFDSYFRQIERAIGSDLARLSKEDRALVQELFHLLRIALRGIRPSSIRKAVRRLIIGRPAGNVDDFGRDAEFIERMRPVIEFLFYRYFRVTAEGTENVPGTGPGLLVANHSGILPLDALMLQFAVEEFHPSGRPLRILIEEWFTALPFLSYTLTRMGQLRGSQDNASRLLNQGELVGVFPEGVRGLEKPYSQRYHLQRFGRGGSIRLAMRTGAPIVPVAILGAEETYPVLFTSGFVANALRVPYFPFTPLFPWLGPLGMIPLPSKWHIRIGERVALGDFSPGSWEDDILVNTLNEDVRRAIQDMLTDMVQRRRSLFFG